MNRFKRIIAIVCVAFLVGIYIVTFIMALADSSATMFMFKGCVICTIFIPVAAYGFMLLHRYAMTRAGRKDYYSDNDPKDQ